MKQVITFLTLALVVLATDCGSGPDNKTLLVSNQWILEEIVYADSTNKQQAQPSMTLQFSDSMNRVSGRGVCNNFFGVYELTGEDNINIEVQGSTRMMCPDQAFEDRYFAMLNLVDTYKVTKNMLELKVTAQGITLK